MSSLIIISPTKIASSVYLPKKIDMPAGEFRFYSNLPILALHVLYKGLKGWALVTSRFFFFLNLEINVQQVN